MFDNRYFKEMILAMGADLCGIAPVERFKDAPEGFRPGDIYQGCRAVIVYALRVPHSSLDITSCVPYTHVNNIITQEVDRLGIKIALELEALRIKAVPIPSDDPYEYWEEESSYGRAVLSMRHAGLLAGLGAMGRNTLLINKELGNMIQLGAVLIDKELAGDPPVDYEVCPPDCSLCIESCPRGALDGRTVNQKLCRPLSNYRNEKGYVLKKCNICRMICPQKTGLKSKEGECHEG